MSEAGVGEDIPQFEEGSKVFRATGEEGIFLGYTDKDGKRYGQIQTGDIVRNIPVDRLSSLLSLVKPAEESTEKVVMDQSAKEALIKSTRRPEVYEFPDNIETTEAQKRKIHEIMKIAHEMGCVFRGDDRHPLQKGEINEDIDTLNEHQTEPPFKNGLSLDFNKKDEPVYTTTDINYALHFPGTKSTFLYIINPNTIYNTTSEIEKMRDGHITVLSENIPNTDIYAAIGINGEIVTDVLRNPYFRDPSSN